MNILHLIDIPWWSGLSSYAFDCANAHRDLGHRVTIASQDNSLPYQKSIKDNFNTIPIQGRNAVNSLFNFFTIGKTISKLNPDWIVAHTGSTHWIAWRWGKTKNIPVIRTRATSQKVRSSKINLRIYSETKWIVTASENLKNECCIRLSENLKDKIHSLYPPVKNPIGNLNDASNKKIKIGLLARLDPVKGHINFLKAAKLVQESFPGAEFHLAGSEENLKWRAILKESEKLGIRNIVYHGFLGEKEVWEFIGNSTLGVIASTGSEEVSRALMEWMSAKKAVVSTYVGCIPEILKDGEGGFIVPKTSPAKMAQRIKEILSQPELNEKMGQFNYSFYEKHFSPNVFKSKWNEILQRQHE